MTHHDKTESLKHREALVLQHRIASFLLVFSVIIVALVMSTAAVQNRDAACQDRSQEVICDNLLVPTITREEITQTITDVLFARRAVLDMNAKTSLVEKSRTVQVLDTAENTIAANGFRLLHRSDGVNHHYDLRAIFDTLCGSRPTISMEVLPNVDYEKVVYHTKTISLMNGTRKYMLQSSLNTRDAARITSFSQLQNLFPGFNAITAVGKLSPQSSVSYSGASTGGQVYYNGHPLDITIGIQQWYAKDLRPLFWRVTLSTESVFAESDLASLEMSLQAAFIQKQYICGKECTSVFNGYLR